MAMPPQIPLLLLLLTSLPPILPASLPENPDPLHLQPLFSPPSTIPAFPEQSDMASSSCPLSLPGPPLPSLSLSCSPARRLSSCCPPLAAFLYSAYAPTALSLPAARPPNGDLPVLPDDSESCAGQVEKALRSGGVDLPRINATCDVAYCYCGVRLRRLTCAGAFVASEAEGRWVPSDEDSRTLERECQRPGTAGCNRCLSALNQLQVKSRESSGSGSNAINSGSKKTKPNDRECQLMGLTWLLSKNHTLYLPTATSIVRAFMASPDDADGQVAPASCTVPHDQMPFAVGSAEIDGDGGSSAVKSPPTWSSLLTLFSLIILCLFLPLNF